MARIASVARFIVLTLAVFVALLVGLFLLQVAIGQALTSLALGSDILPVTTSFFWSAPLGAMYQSRRASRVPTTTAKRPST